MASLIGAQYNYNLLLFSIKHRATGYFDIAHEANETMSWLIRDTNPIKISLGIVWKTDLKNKNDISINATESVANHHSLSHFHIGFFILEKDFVLYKRKHILTRIGDPCFIYATVARV